jgi:hypothetical protein
MARLKTKAAKAAVDNSWEADSCRIYPQDNGNFLIIVRSSDHDNVKGYLNYSEVKEELEDLAAAPSLDDAIGKRIFKAETFSLTFEEEPDVVDFNDKDFFDLETAVVVGHTI